MSVLASRLDRASENHCVNRSANLRLLEEIAEQFAQSRPGSERYVPAIGTRYRAVSLPLPGGEGYGRLRRVPDVRTKAVVTNRGKLTRQGRTTGIFMGRTKGLNSSAAYGDRLDCEQFAFGLFPNGDRRPSSKASHLIADDARPLSCDQKWIDPGGRTTRDGLSWLVRSNGGPPGGSGGVAAGQPRPDGGSPGQCDIGGTGQGGGGQLAVGVQAAWEVDR